MDGQMGQALLRMDTLGRDYFTSQRGTVITPDELITYDYLMNRLMKNTNIGEGGITYRQMEHT